MSLNINLLQATQLEGFLYRTILGFRLDKIELNCIYTHKALLILEDLLAERSFRSYQLAIELNCPSSQWFNSYCKKLDINVVNAQKLEDLRRKYCTTRVMENFYALVKGLIHDTQALIYNMDETSVCANAKRKIILPKGKHPYVAEDKLIGHI